MTAKVNNPLERLKQLSVCDVMVRKVAVIPATATMKEAARLLAGRGIGGAPVVDGDQRCIGVLSSSDFLRFQEDSGAPSPPPKKGALPPDSVQRYMTAPVHTISPDAGITEASELMCTQHVHRLIVLDDREKPIGLISTLDVVAAVVKAVDECSERAGSTARGEKSHASPS